MIVRNYQKANNDLRLTMMITIQYNTIQYNTIQYNTIQYNTIQFQNTINLMVNLISCPACNDIRNDIRNVISKAIGNII